MNPTRRLRFALAALLAAGVFWPPSRSNAADTYLPFSGEKTAWHGFDRYDFLMDDATGAITPMLAPASEVANSGIDVTLKDGKRRCVVVVPRKAAPGYPWSWRGCYWNHEPQTEIELLNRGFHIAYVAPDPGRQGTAWDRWYEFLAGRHGLSKKAAFIGMSKGGVNEFNWGVVNPEKVACIYADNPALYDEDFAKLPELAKHDVPLLHICGTEDMLLQRHTLTVESLYHRLGGDISVLVKEGQAHHPHSLRNPTLIADWIVKNIEPTSANRPEFADSGFTKSHFYSLEPSYIYLPEEHTYATARGPAFAGSYDRYDAPPTGTFKTAGMSIVVPRTPAPAKPWVLRAGALDRGSTVDQALLAKGFYIVTPPLTAQAGMLRQQWDDVYKLMVDNGFSKKPALEGTAAGAGEAYAWAIANPEKVSSIYARNPSLHSLMSKSAPIDNLAPLANARVPILHDCGALDPLLDTQTRVVEKRYKALGGQITVIAWKGEGHFPLSPKDPKPAVDFILRHQQ